jgi:ParB/RepB/Spo0J family partition protein
MKIKTSRQGAGNPLLLQMLSDGELMRVDLALVDRDENQPRHLKNVHDGIADFAAEIKRDGLIHYPVFNIKDNGRFEIVVGERRTAAFRLNGEETIPAICKRFTKDEKRVVWEIQYAENDQKNNKPLSPVEEAQWWSKYTETFWEGSLSRAAEARGVSRAIISQKLKILDASPEMKAFIDHNIKDVTSAYELAKLEADNYDKAQTWIGDYEAGKITGSIRENLKAVGKTRKAKGSTSLAKKAASFKNSAASVESEDNFPLNEKLLLKRVARRDFSGQYLAYAFLSVQQKSPFQKSLHEIANLDAESYQLFYQILHISQNASQFEERLTRLENKITVLLDQG